MAIKDMLIAIREEKGYSKRTVSEMTGIPYTTYIKYESGERKDVSVQSLEKLSDFYGVSVDYLLGREQPDEKPDPISQLCITIGAAEEERQLLYNFFKMPKDERLNAIRFLSKLTSPD